MLVDARTVPDGARIECDIAIVGAGAAGLTIARQFIGSGRNVCLVESGGFELDLDTQALYDGDNIGLTYFPLELLPTPSVRRHDQSLERRLRAVQAARLRAAPLAAP